MMLILALGLVVVASIFIISLIRPSDRTSAWLLFHLLNFTNIVLTGEVASLLSLLDNTGFFVSFHLLIAGVAGALWLRMGRPSLMVMRWPSQKPHQIRGALTWIRKNPDLAVLFSVIALAMLYNALLILVVPPNNNDSLRYHLARVGFWLQNGNILPWPTAMVQQIFSPINAQLNFLWLILLSGNDSLIGFVQWFSVIFTLVGIFGIAKLLGSDQRSSLFSALIFACFPIVLLQSSTAQIDMITTFLFVSSVFFYIHALSKNEDRSLFFSALAFGLGLGTKQTFFYLALVFGVLLLLVMAKYGRRIFKRILVWGLSVLLCFTLFGMYINIINIRAFGTPFGPSETVSYITGIDDPGYTVRSLVYNIPRTLYNALDTSGLPRPIDGYAHKVKAYPARFLADLINFQIEGVHYTFFDTPFNFFNKNLNQEDNAWFGPVSVLLLFPALIYQFIAGTRARDPYRMALALMVPVFLLIHSLLWPNWSPYNGRYYAPVIATATPLIACFRWEKRPGQISRWFFIALSALIVIVTVLYNPAKQVAGKQAKWVNIWTADRATLLTIQDFSNRDLMLLVQNAVPAQTTLGIAHLSEFNQYPLFGEGLTRHIVPIYPMELVSDAKWLDHEGIMFLLVERVPSYPTIPETFQLIGQVKYWSLYRRQ